MTHAVCSKIETEHTVSVANQRRGGALGLNYEGFDEFVGFAAFVRLDDSGNGIVDRMTCSVHHGVVGQFDPIPATVPVHGVITSRDRGDETSRTAVGVVRSGRDDVSHEVCPGLRRRVAAVEEPVDGDSANAMAPRQLHGGSQVLVGRVDAAFPDEAQ